MTKRLVSVFIALALALGVPFAGAADGDLPPLVGKVTSIQGKKVQIEVSGEKPGWVKKGSGLKVNGAPGKIIEVTTTTVTFNCRKAGELKVGDEVSVQKGPAPPAGC